MCNKVIQVFLVVSVLQSQYVQSENSTESGRTFFPLVFSNGASLQAVFAVLVPLDIRPWQNIVCLNNLRAQYAVPTNYMSEYSFFKTRDFGVRPDSTRMTAYHIVETVVNKTGINGHACILRCICETAQTPLNHYGNGLVGELFHLFFTPGEHEIVDKIYTDAMLAGRQGADCISLFPRCPLGHGMLDSISAFL